MVAVGLAAVVYMLWAGPTDGPVPGCVLLVSLPAPIVIAARGLLALRFHPEATGHHPGIRRSDRVSLFLATVLAIAGIGLIHLGADRRFVRGRRVRSKDPPLPAKAFRGERA